MNAKHAMTGYAGLMLLYTAWRTYDYMSGSLQGVGKTTATIVALAFLAFAEIGLLIWLHLASKNTTSDAQETISTVMIWTDFVGSMIIGLADILKHNTLYQVDLSLLDPILLLTPWLIVVLNVGGYLLYFQNDSGNELDKANRQLAHEENMLEVEARREAVKMLRAEKGIMTKALAPHYVRDVKEKVNGRTARMFLKEANQTTSQSLPAPKPGKAQDDEQGNFTTPQ